MKNLFALILVAGTFVFASCESKTETTEETTTVEETTVEETAPVMEEETTVDTAAATMDTTVAQ
ncbi:MAG: hypothetical protein LPK21_10260 [Hymenobacteraceae bacterium]|nr:hypothetical protein [Hymenobacteraceae bacterium]MDX5512634.1 hypothetical protein [Hymenobacteraceae bacterium]